MTDKKAMNLLAAWMEDFDPTLQRDTPEWVWSLVSLIDDLIMETGREPEYAD